MKKYLSILVALLMVLGLSGKAMATVLDTETIPVTATVANHAAITDIDGITLVFDGTANQTATGSDIISVETNTNVEIAVSTTNLTGPGGDAISTSVTIGGFSFVTQNYVQAAGPVAHTVEVSGTTGAISAQAAGDYSATVTVTVSAI
jgi:hypothetical protein